MENKSKPSSEQDGERKAEQAGTSTEHSEKSTEQHGINTEQHGEHVLGTDEALLKKAVLMRTQGKTYREIENALGIPKSTFFNYLKRSNMELEQQAEPEPEVNDNTELEGEISRIHEHSTPSSTQNIPEGYAASSSPIRDSSPFVHFDTQSFIAFRESLPKPQQKLLDGYTSLGQKTWEQQNRNNGDHNNGHGYSLGNDAEQEVEHELAKLIKAKRIKMLMTEDTPPKNADSLGVREVIDIFKLLGGSQKGTEKSPVDYVLAGAEMRANIEKTVQTHSAATNEYDLKKTDMEQNERLDNRKQDWEEKKWQEEQGATGKVIEQVKGILEGPIGKVIGSIGEAAKDKYLGQGSKIPTVDAQCPNCSNKFKANPELDPIQCPKCGVLLQKNPPVAQKTVEEIEPLQPETSEPQKIAESTEKQSPIKHDLGFEFARGD